MHLPLLQDILIIIGLSVVIVFLLGRLRLPSILGFLITGLLIGPNGLTLIGAIHEVEIIAEIGVILLLFVIGMELSLKQLISIRKTIFVGGLVQVGVAIIIAAIIYRLLGFSWAESVFIGFLFSLSSTAIVLKILQDRNEISAPHGRNALGILIFQDLIAIPMILVTPILAGNSTNISYAVIELLVKTIIVIAITIISARYLVPKLMLFIVKSRSKELFLLTTLTLCFAIAFLTSEAGLSLALGAFLAGLIISESEFSHQATSIILPFKELFTSFFFISIGMLLNLNFFFEHAGIILLLVTAVVIIKVLIGILATSVLNYPPRVVILTGLALFQIGEFSFIISKVGIQNGIMTDEMNQYFLAVSIITMMLTPFIMMFSEKIAAKLIPKKVEKKWSAIPERINKSSDGSHLDLKNHLIIVGYGINGKNVAKAAQYSGIPYIILELNADTVKQEAAKGENILFGDATQEHILESINISKARAIVIAISDPVATKQIVSKIRLFSQSIYVIVRTRYVSEINELINIGADEVIPEEFETSITIFTRVLHNLLVPIDEIEALVDEIKEDNYKFLHYNSLKENLNTKFGRIRKPTKITDFKLNCIRIKTDSGQILDKSIGEANIRKQFGINILAISRKDNLIYPVKPSEKIQQYDLVYVSGDSEHIDTFYKMFG